MCRQSATVCLTKSPSPRQRELSGVAARLATLSDPRDRRGRRHSLVSVLLTAACAVLAGARVEGAGARVEGAVAHWEGPPAVRDRLEAIGQSSCSLVVFLEHVPHTLAGWLADHRETAMPEGEDSSPFRWVEEALMDGADFMSSRGLVHFDSHFANILTDGRQLYFADFGRALSSRFDLTADESDFFRGPPRVRPLPTTARSCPASTPAWRVADCCPPSTWPTPATPPCPTWNKPAVNTRSPSPGRSAATPPANTAGTRASPGTTSTSTTTVSRSPAPRDRSARAGTAPTRHPRPPRPR